MKDECPAIAVITCDVLRDEVHALAKFTDSIVHIEILEQGLHNDPPKLRRVLQDALDRVETTCAQANAIVLGYGLCSRGTEGVTTRRCKLILPRAHDCITLLLGCRHRYAEYVAEHPGTYWYSPGWNRCHVPPGKERYELYAARYRQQFDEDDVQYLMETEQAWFKSYDRASFVDLGVGAVDGDVDYTRRCADWLGWSFDRQHGDPALLRALLCGEWDDDRFLVLEPGQTLQMTADERIVRVAPVQVTVRGTASSQQSGARG